MIIGFLADYARICYQFNVEDAATRANVRSYIIPRLTKERRDLAYAVWSCRKTRFGAMARKDLRVFLSELRTYREAVRAAKCRLTLAKAI